MRSTDYTPHEAKIPFSGTSAPYPKQEEITMDRKRFTLEIPWPNMSRVRLASRLTGWLPTRGNVIFTLVIAALLVLAQSAGALP
jgi:hypothetical protein